MLDIPLGRLERLEKCSGTSKASLLKLQCAMLPPKEEGSLVYCRKQGCDLLHGPWSPEGVDWVKATVLLRLIPARGNSRCGAASLLPCRRVVKFK